MSFFSLRGRLSASAVLTVLLLAGPASTATSGADEAVRIPDLDGHLVDPLALPPGGRALVAVFASVDCPISNRYAPELRRIYEQFAGNGVQFLLIYPNPAESPDAIRAHLAAFNHPGRVLRDPDHRFVKAAGVTITPEAVVYDAAGPTSPGGRRRAGRLVYRGRIDDRYVRLGLERPAPTRRDLVEALDAALAGRPVEPARTDAVGCFIADFVHVH